MSSRPAIKALLIDVSGNLHVGSKPTPGAVDALNRLRAAGIPFRLCSNLSKESTGDLIQRLTKLGFTVSSRNAVGRREVWTSIGGVAGMVKQLGLKRPYLLLSESAREEVLEETPGKAGSASLSDESEGPYDSVVIGLAPSCFDYTHLNTAFRILVGEHDAAGPKNAPLIATHKAKYIEKEDPPGLNLGTGPFVTALENASGRTAHVVGKPTKTFFELVINDIVEVDARGFADGRVVIVGDDVEADLGGGAVELGLWRVLVKTGKYRQGDETKAGVVPPDEVHGSFAEFVDSLLRRL